MRLCWNHFWNFDCLSNIINNVLSLVSLFCSLILLLLFTPEYFLFITPNSLFTLFFLNIFLFWIFLILDYIHPPLSEVGFRDIRSDTFISLFIEVFIVFEPYTLFAIMNCGLYFFRLLIDTIANFTLYFLSFNCLWIKY